jgi:hypothetical protein
MVARSTPPRNIRIHLITVGHRKRMINRNHVLIVWQFVSLFFLAFYIVIISVPPIYATDNKNPHLADPQTVVAAYCRADCEGATLSSENYTKSYIPDLLLKREPIGPAWDIAVLIEGFRIVSVSSTADESEVTVEFFVVADWEGIIGLKVEKRTDRHVFKLRRVQNEWKLLDPVDLPPHISLATAIRHTEMLLKIQREVQPDAPEVIRRMKALGTTADKAMQPTACGGG